MTNILARFTHQDETICYITQAENTSRAYDVYMGTPTDDVKIFWHYGTKHEALHRANLVIQAHLQACYS